MNLKFEKSNVLFNFPSYTITTLKGGDVTITYRIKIKKQGELHITNHKGDPVKRPDGYVGDFLLLNYKNNECVAELSKIEFDEAEKGGDKND